ncbi:hypothetical protein E2C01_085259 [Portunus trituberculatus]|uniref:Uncharacterized protein n=1 Tax=Portunus trituberculatus TaxID=210409 RepID=A0A5B7J257_PORTR|nr:hypothetical protein [Portunus trituberculatus]
MCRTCPVCACEPRRMCAGHCRHLLTKGHHTPLIITAEITELSGSDAKCHGAGDGLRVGYTDEHPTPCPTLV